MIHPTDSDLTLLVSQLDDRRIAQQNEDAIRLVGVQSEVEGLRKRLEERKTLGVHKARKGKVEGTSRDAGVTQLQLQPLPPLPEPSSATVKVEETTGTVGVQNLKRKKVKMGRGSIVLE